MQPAGPIDGESPRNLQRSQAGAAWERFFVSTVRKYFRTLDGTPDLEQTRMSSAVAVTCRQQKRGSMRANRWTGLAVLIVFVFGVGASSLWAMPEERDRSAETSARRVQLLGAKQHARSRGMRPEPEKKEEKEKRALKESGTHRTYGRLVLDRKEEKKQKGSKGQSTVVRRRRVIRQISNTPERSNKGGEVRGKDRSTEVRGMNDLNGHGKAEIRSSKGQGKGKGKKGKGKKKR